MIQEIVIWAGLGFAFGIGLWVGFIAGDHKGFMRACDRFGKLFR